MGGLKCIAGVNMSCPRTVKWILSQMWKICTLQNLKNVLKNISWKICNHEWILWDDEIYRTINKVSMHINQIGYTKNLFCENKTDRALVTLHN